jgi:hypothetical protein
MKFNARLNTSHHGPQHPFKDAGVVADSLTVRTSYLIICDSVCNTSVIMSVIYCYKLNHLISPLAGSHKSMASSRTRLITPDIDLKVKRNKPLTGWTTERSGFESRYGQEFSRLLVVQTGTRVHPTSYTMGTGISFPGVKRPRREADHSPPTSAEVKKMWIYTSTSQYAMKA